MRRFHLILGLVVVVLFLLTGQYMEYVHNRLLPDGTRMLYRSRHIYFLLAGILNLSLGLYMAPRPGGWRRTLQIVGSILIALSPGFLLVGFFLEPSWGPEKTSIAPLGIFAIGIGTLLHLLSGIRRSATSNDQDDPRKHTK
jgi:peptidoglycan/LPS O-acetylase OafA/YrhL